MSADSFPLASRRTFLASAAASPLVYAGLRSGDPALTAAPPDSALATSALTQADPSPSPSSAFLYRVLSLSDDSAPEECLATPDRARAFRLADTLNGLEDRQPLGCRAIVTIEPSGQAWDAQSGGQARLPMSANTWLAIVSDDSGYRITCVSFSLHDVIGAVNRFNNNAECSPNFKARTSPFAFVAVGSLTVAPSELPAQLTAITHSGRARVAILGGVYEWWAPRNWRDVPSMGAIVEISEPLSFRGARQRCKWFNAERRLHKSEWAIVVCTDGRKAVQA